MQKKLEKYRIFFKNYWQVLFFVFGFVFDLITLGEIEDQFNVIQHIIYLVLASIFLYFDIFRQSKNTFAISDKYYEYLEISFHFIIGSLLSAFTIFFFKSSNIKTSLLFLLVIITCLIINEFSLEKKYRNILRSSLYSICMTCFFIYFIPLTLGKVNSSIFYFSLSISLILQLIPFAYLQNKFKNISIQKNFLFPIFFVNLFFALTYITKTIPAVPISIKKSGIYRNIEKINSDYQLTYKKPWWAFWRKGEQVFYYSEGDKVYVYFAIYSPSQFDNSINVKWYYYNHNQWQETDSIALRVLGGRKAGYRSFTFKSNINRGSWYAAAFTEDDRELGRIYFDVINQENGEVYPIKKDSY